MTFGVAPAYRQQGLGEHLLERFQQVLVQNDINDLSLHVQRGNEDAFRFYRRHGFELLKVLKHYYFIEEKHYDAMWMRLKDVSTVRTVSIDQSLIGESEPGNEGNLLLLGGIILLIIFLLYLLFQFAR